MACREAAERQAAGSLASQMESPRTFMSSQFEQDSEDSRERSSQLRSNGANELDQESNE